jgi:uncharacterized protein YdbL (DUF1318 family)
MTMIRRFAAIFAMLLAFATAAPAMAQADPVLNQAKASGVVGEMYTGYLGIADEARATPDLRRRVQEVNSKRLQIYTQKSRDTGESVEVIAALTAEKQIARAGSGEAVKPGGSAPWKVIP